MFGEPLKHHDRVSSQKLDAARKYGSRKETIPLTPKPIDEWAQTIRENAQDTAGLMDEAGWFSGERDNDQCIEAQILLLRRLGLVLPDPPADKPGLLQRLKVFGR